MHKGKTKYMINHADSGDILIDQGAIEKVTKFKYLGQTTNLKDTTKEKKSVPGSERRGAVLEIKEILQDRQQQNVGIHKTQKSYQCTHK